MNSGDFLTLLRVYFSTFGISLLSLPITRLLFKKLPDRGYATTRIISTLVISLVVWQLGNLNFPTNTNFFVLIVTLIFLLLNIAVAYKSSFSRPSVEMIKLWIIEEYIFFVGFVGISLVRSYLPNIDSLEKYMDFGFVYQYLLSPTLPAPDMWQAGQAINYYSFGHFWSSVLIRLFDVSPTVGYNLVLGFIAGTAGSIAFSIVYTLVGTVNKFSGYLGGLVGAFSTVLGGNTHVIWYMIKNRSLEGYWYADATRFIQNTIHEFPGYSFVVADLHGHLIDLPIVLTFILMLIYWIKQRGMVMEVIMGVFLGIMMMTNTWDMAVYGMVLSIAGVMMLVKQKQSLLVLFRSALVMIGVMILTALPWLIGFESISSGFALVKERSPLWQLFVLWSGGLFVCVSALLVIKGDDKNKTALYSLATAAMLLIIIPEFIYAKDIYPDHPRANTMFKLTYQASIMISVLIGSLIGKLFEGNTKIKGLTSWVALSLTLLLFLGTMIFPAEAFPNYYRNFEMNEGLDGEKYISEQMPLKYEVINYLRDNRDNTNMVEAVGDSYTTLNMVSVFSGVPTIQGWRVHEWLWRGGYGPVREREEDVREIYEGSDQAKKTELLNKYKVGWILVGDEERQTYNLNSEGLERIGEKVWGVQDSYLIKVEN